MLCCAHQPFHSSVLSHNSLHKDQQALWAPAQGELWQRDGVPAEEAAEAGGAAAEEDEAAESQRQQEGKDGDIDLNRLFEESSAVSFISFMFDALNDEPELNVFDEAGGEFVHHHKIFMFGLNFSTNF